MATVVLKQTVDMLEQIHSQQTELISQIEELREEILDGIHTYGTVQHQQYGTIYVYETDGFTSTLLMDDANVPSLLSASYLHFQNPRDPAGEILRATRRFLLSKDNPQFFQGQFARGIGSQHTSKDFVWPMSIIIEGLTSNSTDILESVWQRLEVSHADTFAMHESFNVNNPKEYTRAWFAWVNSLFSELVIYHLQQLEVWLQTRTD